VGSPLAVLAVPAALLVGLMFASIAMVMTATATTMGSMNNFFTLFLLPMFWVGGAFFPPGPLTRSLTDSCLVASANPCRSADQSLDDGDLSWWMLAWTLELVAFGLAAFWLASRLMRRRLIK
jgi:lipooligosaccharide transport system permease protein